ncbi:MAG: ABC transporter permease subunit, partial [Oscillospiraceae bacterium]|nr:ABC transporter permease subunit [Oscillospiraceae bacterium]
MEWNPAKPERVSIIGGNGSRNIVEWVMNVIFTVCGLAAVIFVAGMSLYLVLTNAPAIAGIGVFKFLFGQVWDPENSQYGIAAMILSSVVATFCAVLVALPTGVLLAVFLSKLIPQRLASVLRTLIELLAGIPSVVYGLLGALLIVPLVFRLQTALGLPSSGCLLSAIVILVIMILPTIVSVSETAIRAVPKAYEDASLALGSTRLQSIFKATV